MRAVMGGGGQTTADRRAEDRAKKASYGAELQAQMRAQEEAKKREKMERLGIDVPGMQGGFNGPGSPPGRPSMMGPPPPYGVPPQQQFNAGSPGSMRNGGYAPPPPYGPPQPPSFAPMHPPQMGFSPSQQQGPPGGNWGHLQQQGYQQPMQQQPPQQYGMPSFGGPPPPIQLPMGQLGGGNYNGPPSPSGGYGPGNGRSFSPPPMGGMGGGYGGQPMGNGMSSGPQGPGHATMQRMENKAKQSQYRMELEAQMRDKEERKRADKHARMAEDMRKEAEMAAYNPFGRGGAGAPHRNAAGQIVSDLSAMHRANGGPNGGGMQGPPGPMGPPQGGYGGPQQGGYGGPQQGGYGGPPPPMDQYGPPQGYGGPPMGGGGGPPSPGGVNGGYAPNLRFRSDNAYLTPGELDNKQRQARELQEALEGQIQEKRRAKEAEKQRELAEIHREEARLRADQAQLQGAGPGGPGGNGAGGGPGKDPKDVLHDAWERARIEAEELKRAKFANKRGNARSMDMDNDPGWQQQQQQELHQHPVGNSPRQTAPQGDGGIPPQLPPVFGSIGVGNGNHAMGGGRPSTPLADKVRAVAAAELAAVKNEFAAEAASLREVVEAQSQTVAALKSHAERMEVEALRSKDQMQKMRIDMIRKSAEAPEHLMRVIADYIPDHASHMPPPPALMDIGLDLPPPAALQRRAHVPSPVYDMGGLIPAINNSAVLASVSDKANVRVAAGLGTLGGVANGRPLTQGMRQVNPLEASMAAESVLIYPNGRELQRNRSMPAAVAAGGGIAMSALANAIDPNDLPFKSLEIQRQGAAMSRNKPENLMIESLDPGPLPHTPGAALHSSLQQGAHSGADSVRMPRAVSMDGGKHAATPIDVETLVYKNTDKLQMLKDITKLNATDSVEALDEFLSKFAAQRPGLPDRTASPVLRINTPQTETIHHHASTTPAAPALYQQRPGMHQLPMGAGTTSKPATPIHLLGGSKPGTPSAAARGAAGSSPNGAPAAASGTIRRTPPLPSGGGLGTPTHGRRAASPATATGAVPGSSSRPASSTSPMAQLQQLRAGQGSFSATGAMEGALTATPPSVPPRPRSRTPSTAGSLTAGAAAHFGLQGGGGMADTLDAEMSRGLGSPPPSGTGGGPSAPGHRASGTGMGNSMNMAGGGNGSRPGSSTTPSGGMLATADGIPRSPMLAGPRAGGRLSSAGSQRSLTHATAAVS